MQIVQIPQFKEVEGSDPPTFTMETNTADAQIYYTLDDSYPSPANDQAKVYDGTPIVIPPEGLLIRACAYAPGAIASAINRANITATLIE